MASFLKIALRTPRYFALFKDINIACKCCNGEARLSPFMKYMLTRIMHGIYVGLRGKCYFFPYIWSFTLGECVSSPFFFLFYNDRAWHRNSYRCHIRCFIFRITKAVLNNETGYARNILSSARNVLNCTNIFFPNPVYRSPIYENLKRDIITYVYLIFRIYRTSMTRYLGKIYPLHKKIYDSFHNSKTQTEVTFFR